jgi:hypothetical protein
MSYRARWSVTLTVVALIVAAVTYAATSSWGWALLALMATGVVANSIASPRGRHPE